MLRSYNPQIGRFLQHDPYDEFASGYVGMGNDPGNLVDPSGGCTTCFTSMSATLNFIFSGTLPGVTVIAKARVPSTAITISRSFKSAALSLVSLASNLAWNMSGFYSALSDNALGTNFLSANQPKVNDPSSAKDNWDMGVRSGHAASIALAVMEGGAGKSLTATGSAELVGAGVTGFGAVKGLVTIGVGYGFQAHSIFFFGRGAEGVISGRGLVKFEGGKEGSSSNRKTGGDSPSNETLQAAEGGNGTYSKSPPGDLTKLKRGQGWRDADGNIWKRDMKHQDHWDVTDPKTGKKIKEIDFKGYQIWPDGPKNKNKR